MGFKKYGDPPDKLDIRNINLNGHTQIYHKGKHYDIETLNGVKNFWDLPIYKRQLND